MCGSLHPRGDPQVVFECVVVYLPFLPRTLYAGLPTGADMRRIVEEKRRQVYIWTGGFVRHQSIDIVVYRITGRQGFITIPHRYCEECDLTVNVARGVVDELSDPNVRLIVRPWMLWFWLPIWRGGWHAPILTVNGRVVTQGIVPSRETLLEAIGRARGSEPALSTKP